MNPLAWRREHQVALLLGGVLGAVIALVVGFMYRGLNYGTLSSELFWSWSTIRWGVLGALLGGFMIYVRQLLHAP
jgi:Mg/Co/Ni transporter MgtE